MIKEIIDFHTHPYHRACDDICIYSDIIGSSEETFLDDMTKAGISRFAGSVISKGFEGADAMIQANRSAYKLASRFGKKYIPGIQIDPRFPDESLKEIELARECGVRLIGELVPYMYGWSYAEPAFSDILDTFGDGEFTVSLHTTDLAVMEEIAKAHPGISFVFAHPGEKDRLMQHIEIMKRCENVYLDLSGTGLFRFGMLAKLVREVGSERILFGSDYPICDPYMNIAGVLGEHITDEDRENIFAGNAIRLLCL